VTISINVFSRKKTFEGNPVSAAGPLERAWKRLGRMRRIFPYYVTILLVSVSLFPGCEAIFGPEEVKIPFGYDPDFDYLSVLKSSPAYAYEATDGLPDFTYQDSTDENLRELKNTYNLENASGDGDELSKIFNLLKWVHQTIRHDGGNTGPGPENSLSILQYCQETGNGVNCVMMAIVLNEAYLAMGFQSRVVHGNAKKFIFNGDWHAYNMVYSTTLSKWLFVDPTYQAYFLDEHGNPLSIAELREHLRQGETLILNDDADYNGQEADRTSYLHYLTKNLYRFSCAVQSAFGNYWIFNIPDGTQRTFFHLDPKNDRQEGPGLAENHFTSNPTYYWSEP